jgi:hypothetical protein
MSYLTLFGVSNETLRSNSHTSKSVCDWSNSCAPKLCRNLTIRTVRRPVYQAIGLVHVIQRTLKTEMAVKWYDESQYVCSQSCFHR